MAYDALLLDHDGVLVDVADVDRFRSPARQALRDAGVESPDPEAVEQLKVSVEYGELVSVCDRVGVDPEALWHCRDEHIAETLREITRNGGKEPYPDVRSLSKLDVPLGIVSNNQRRVVEFVMSHYGLLDMFETVRARDPRPGSLREKKPEPTYIERAMADLDASDPLYIGDKETDVVAGDRAGIDTAFLSREHNAGASLDSEPTYRVDGLEDVAAIVGRA